MRKFVFLICGDGMFQSSTDLGAALENIIADYYVQHNTLPEDHFVDEALSDLGISCYRFSLPEDINANADVQANVRAALAGGGRGIAFSNGWDSEWSVSILLEAYNRGRHWR
jgi:hypothetical protein